MGTRIQLTAAVLMLIIAAGMCAGQTDGAAKVIALTGRVSVMRESTPWVLNVGDLVQPRQVIITGPDGYAMFQVADGSTFEVFENSRLVFRDNPGNWRDLLELFLGRIKVDIQKWGGHPNRNRIRTPTAIISVRGTVFNVEVEDEDTTLVLVHEGQVAVQHALLPRGEPKILSSGEWIRVYKNMPLANKSVDKGSVLGKIFRAADEAIWVVLSRPPGGAGGTGGPTTGGVPPPPADSCRGGKCDDPPPPPPPPPKH